MKEWIRSKQDISSVEQIKPKSPCLSSRAHDSILSSQGLGQTLLAASHMTGLRLALMLALAVLCLVSFPLLWGNTWNTQPRRRKSLSVLLTWETSAYNHLTALLWGTHFEAEHHNGELVINQSHSPYEKRELKRAEDEEGEGPQLNILLGTHHQWFHISLSGSVSQSFNHLLIPSQLLLGEIPDADYWGSILFASLSSQGVHQCFSSPCHTHQPMGSFYQVLRLHYWPLSLTSKWKPSRPHAFDIQHVAEAAFCGWPQGLSLM